ncbi:MAG: winged helix-turn-helix domain-containing protein [Chloroflexi bacterium]|nr:winged helix-turn-helix domain-containing protein [Chloroflexota bacterium]
MADRPTQPNAIPQAFDSLKAEDESAWFDRVFVSPPNFETIAGPGSVIVFGEQGTGKTALKMALMRRARPPGVEPTHLVVEWHPPRLLADSRPSQAARACVDQALSASALAVLQHLSRWPAAYGRAPLFARDILHWFVRQHVIGTPEFVLSLLEEQGTLEGIDLARRLLTQPAHEVLNAQASESEVMNQLAVAVNRMGLAGIWLIMEGLEPWAEAQDPGLTSMLTGLLSMLALFEVRGLSMKLILPTTLEATLVSCPAVSRLRLHPVLLTWDAVTLKWLVEARLAALAGRDSFALNELCDAPEFADWLTKYGGLVPRGWLELAHTIVRQYLLNHDTRPLTADEWEEAWHNDPPMLRIDIPASRVYLGYFEVKDLKMAQYRLLRYLYLNHTRFCTRSELYYRVHLNMTREPTPEDDDYQEQKNWGGTIDTLIWRLRKAIESDPESPIYIVSDRGRGVQLRHAR